ncbi:MAG: radical SAM protein [Promethearchaeia archaeon]
MLEKFKANSASWEEFWELIDLNSEELKPFLSLARDKTVKKFGNKLKIYIPGNLFPAISLTGTECSLHCEHCNEKYLHGMVSILSNNDLKQYLLKLYKSGGKGVLLSGGCDPNGAVPLLKYLDTVKEIKKKTNLIFNAHTGLLNEETAKKLADAGVDIISFDINMDIDIIKDIYHLNKDLDDYKHALELLKKYNLNVVPHICIGLYYGKLHKELESLKFIKESGLDPSLIVLIALIPPKEKNNKFIRPNPEDIARIIMITRFIFPETEISLGCMRPRGDIKVEVEKIAILSGITRIEIPSPKTLKWLKEYDPKISLEFYSACCAIPKEFESFVKSSQKEIKRYINILQ